MARVFVSCTLPGDAVDRLAREHHVVVGEERVGVNGVAFLEAAATFDGIISLFNDRVDVALLDRAPRLRVVANFAVGYDNIDVRTCAARGIVVTNTPGVLSEATADLAFGLVLSAAIARLMAKLLYGVSPTDPFTYFAVALLWLLVATAACYLPARRAARVDPMEVLRNE